MAPAFDNGTSLGYELLEDRLPSFTGDRLDRYILKGTHHMRLQEGDAKKPSHVLLCQAFAQQHPYATPKMLNVLSFPEKQLQERLERLVAFETPVKLSEQRAQFMLRATLRRREVLGEALSTVGVGT
jgi:hypothetical protein